MTPGRVESFSSGCSEPVDCGGAADQGKNSGDFEADLVVFVVGLRDLVEASTNQVADKQMPICDLPSKILCRVINVQLKLRL
ncbi:Auxin response factor 2 [Acorus gramineus]|uniref:Auxin response factor 2 n=1 Tax=Acorus gramineus TaxID=55184 RepID=A0AAV9B2Z6_ACOGR|nr:Auxin response factor 2 [Acorus gramineus]